MYYLQSRYYSPKIDRFISADDHANMGANGQLSSYNLFAYCENNPVNRTDETGNVSRESAAKFGLVVMVVGLLVLTTAATGGGALALATGGVASSGAMANAAITAGTTAAVGSTIMQFAKESKKSGKERATNKPSWANKNDVDPSLSANENATKMLNNKYGVGNWKKGPGTEHNQIKKWIDRGIKLFVLYTFNKTKDGSE